MRSNATTCLSGDDPAADRPQPAPTRSLVPFTAGRAGPGGRPPGDSSHCRPSAPFIAQLIALAQGAPQTRLRRRNDAGHTAQIYQAGDEGPQARPTLLRLA